MKGSRKIATVATFVMLLAFISGCSVNRSGPDDSPGGPGTTIDTSLPPETQRKQQIIHDLLVNLQEGFPAGQIAAVVPGVKFEESQSDFLEGNPYLSKWRFNGKPNGNEIPVTLYFVSPESGDPEVRKSERTYLVTGKEGRFRVTRK